MAAHYSPEAVQASLEMVSQAMRAKDAAARRLQEQVAALVSAASGDGGDSAAAGPPSDAQVAETCERLRAQAAGEQPLVAAEREKRRAVIEQLAAVKSELDAARQAQDAAVAELALLDAAVQEMRAEREELQATLTQRESAYLTLLETVQELFRQHSPTASGDQSPAREAGEEAEGIDDDATGARLQRKLHEWQERLAAAARLRESGGQASAGFGSSQSMGGGRSPGASSQSDGLASRVRAAIDSAGAGGAEAAEAADSPRSSSGGAVSAASELDFHSAVSSAAPSPEKGGPLAPASASKPAPGPGSPRIASAWLKGVQASAADEPGAEGDADGGAASPAPAPAGSRIKQMGLQAAEQAPAAAPRAAQQAAAAQQRGRKHRGGRRK